MQTTLFEETPDPKRFQDPVPLGGAERLKRLTEPGSFTIPISQPLTTMVRHTDSSTSHEAATSLLPHLGRLQNLVLQTLREHPEGLTDYELTLHTGLEKNSASKRRGELVTSGLAKNSGKKRKTNTGRNAWVWVAL